MKQIFISSECIKCGICIVQSNLLKENEIGEPVPILASGIIQKKLIPEFKKVMDDCPVNAISLIEYRGIINNLETKQSSSKGVMNNLETKQSSSKCENNKKEDNQVILNQDNINEIKKTLGEKIQKYKNLEEYKDKYKFNIDEFYIPLPYSIEENKYNYKSDSSAERAGLREFDRIMYSQKRAIIQKLLIQYKTKILDGYSTYKRKKGNYYYDINCEIEKKLEILASEIKELSNNKIKLDKKFTNFEVEPTFGINGDKMNRELYVYKVRHLEEIHIVDDIIRELEPLSWFDVYVNTDDYEDYRGKYVYCYNLREVTETFAKQILTETAYILNYDDIIIDLLKYPIEKFISDVEKELNKKFEIIEEMIK